MIRRLDSFYHLYDFQIIQRKFGYIFSRTVGKIVSREKSK